MKHTATLLATVALAVMLHQPLLRGRAPVERLGEYDTLADCYRAWDQLPKAQQSFTWCSDTGNSGGIGTDADGKRDPKKPVE
jgi:hypothetical protein